MPLILPSNTITGGYEVANSLRFDDGSSDSLTRTPSSASNQKTYTISAWFKLSSIASSNQIFGAKDPARSSNDGIWVLNTGKIMFYIQGVTVRESTQVLRDFSAWYHIVASVDTTQSTASNRLKIYLNGTQITSFSTSADPTQNVNTAINGTNLHNVGKRISDDYFDGYMAEVVLIDGTALDPTSFGEFDEDTNIWKPIDVSGLTFGTNGFYLDFENSGSLGADVSGNGNNFTVNNLTSIDQVTDTPTNNFATLNPLNTGTGTLSEGNLKWVTSASTGYLTFATIAIDMSVSNKFYCEMKLNSSGTVVLGIAPTTLRGSDTGRAGSYGYYSNGDKYSGTSASSYGASFTTNDIIGMLAGNGTVTFYKNGVSQGTAFSGLTGTYIPFLAEVSCDVSMNFGNPPFTISSGNSDPASYGNFEYSTNSGYALCTKNLAEFG